MVLRLAPFLERIFPANLLTGAKFSAFLTHLLTDTNKTNYICSIAANDNKNLNSGTMPQQ